MDTSHPTARSGGAHRGICLLFPTSLSILLQAEEQAPLPPASQSHGWPPTSFLSATCCPEILTLIPHPKPSCIVQRPPKSWTAHTTSKSLMWKASPMSLLSGTWRVILVLSFPPKGTSRAAHLAPERRYEQWAGNCASPQERRDVHEIILRDMFIERALVHSWSWKGSAARQVHVPHWVLLPLESSKGKSKVTLGLMRRGCSHSLNFQLAAHGLAHYDQQEPASPGAQGSSHSDSVLCCPLACLAPCLDGACCSHWESLSPQMPLSHSPLPPEMVADFPYELWAIPLSQGKTVLSKVGSLSLGLLISLLPDFGTQGFACTQELGQCPL